jgi:GntR family histidine utilization transcriptional repressor
VSTVQVDEDSPVPYFQQLHDLLLADIEAGRIKGRLPSARDLVQDTGLSHATTERALRQLRDEGVVVAVRGKGYYVKRDQD